MEMKRMVELDLKQRPAWTSALFKETEKLLMDEEFQESLLYIAPEDTMKQYRGMVDFLFCELIVSFRKRCFLYYQDKGPPLKEILKASPERIAGWDIFLAASLDIACEVKKQNLQMSWNQFRDTAEKILRQ